MVQTSVKVASSLADEIRPMNSSPDGNTLAAVTHRGILKLFRAATLDEVALGPDSVQALPNVAQ